VVASTSLAQQTDNLTDEVGDCEDLESPDERFACYERSVESARREQQRPEAAASQAPPPGSRQAPPGQLRSDIRNVAV
jgi:hypothetical protein